MAWYNFVVEFEKGKSEIVNAWLLNLNFDAIVENDTNFNAYIENPEDVNALYNEVKNINGVKHCLVPELQEEKNWNEEWEKNFAPISIDDMVYIRADFHEKNDAYPYEILISPKMAFGTGHHETTHMMISQMLKLGLTDKTVFDYGCGTAILSVFAKMRNAKHVFGVDIEAPAIENSWEHVEINNLEKSDFDFQLGDIDLASDKKYDVVLANINRRVLLENVAHISSVCHDETIVLLSGILKVDQEIIEESYSPFFYIEAVEQRGEWLCFLMRRKGLNNF